MIAGTLDEDGEEQDSDGPQGIESADSERVCSSWSTRMHGRIGPHAVPDECMLLCAATEASFADCYERCEESVGV